MNMNIKMDQRVLSLLAVLGVAVFLIVGTFFLCQPVFKAIEEAGKQEAAYVQETVMARDLLASKNVKKVVSRLIAKEKISSVMDAITKQAGKNNVSLTLLQPPFAAPDDGNIFSRVLFDMQASATLKNLGEFLTVIRNMPEGLVDIESMRLAPHDASSDLVMAKITFVLFVAKNNGKK